MKQWNGLLKKEWATMRDQFYATVVASFLFTLLIPFGGSFFNWGLDALEVSLILSLVWIGVSVVIPTTMLLISLGREMNRPDNWLHSTASIYKLFGSKVVLAGLVGFVNMLIPIMIIIIGSRYSTYFMGISLKMLFEIGILIFSISYLISLLVMGTGLFFGVLYQLIKPVMRGFAIPVVGILFLFFLWLTERVMTTSAYKKVSEFGPIKGPADMGFKIGEDSFFYEIDATPFYVGDIFLNILFSILLFISAVTLFEKKVRL